MKIFSRMLIILKRVHMILLSLSFVEMAYAVDVNYLVIEKQARPLQIEHYGQAHKGIVTEAVKEIFSEDEYQLYIHTMPFAEMISAMEASNFDSWVGVGSAQWEGIQAKNMTVEPLITVSHALLTVRDGGFKFTSLDDLDDKVVILLDGFDYPGLDPYIKSGKIQELRVKNFVVALKLLNRLKSKACFVEMSLRIKYNMYSNNVNRNDYTFNDFSSVIADYDVHLALDPKMEPTLKNYIDNRIREIKSNGKLQSIYSQYE